MTTRQELLRLKKEFKLFHENSCDTDSVILLKLLEMHIEELSNRCKPTTVKVPNISVTSLEDYEPGKTAYSEECNIGIDWAEECKNVTKQHDEALNKIKALNGVIDERDEQIERLERKLKALSKVKHVPSVCPHVYRYEIEGQPLEDYVERYDKMKEQIQSQLAEIKLISNNVDHWHDKYKRSSEELQKFQCLVTELEVKNNELQRLAQIGRVIEWYYKHSTIEIVVTGGRMSRATRFELFFEAIEREYRKDPENEAF